MKVVVRVIAGRNLPAADSNGKSDPYVIVYQEGMAKYRLGKTPTIKGTLNPHWDVAFETIGLRGMKFKFIVFDWDRFGSDDELGVAEFDPFVYPCNAEVEIPLKPKDSHLSAHVSPHKLVVRIDIEGDHYNWEERLSAAPQDIHFTRDIRRPVLYTLLTWNQFPPDMSPVPAPFPLFSPDPAIRKIQKSFPQLPQCDLCCCCFHHHDVEIACFMGDKKEKGTRHSGHTLVFGPRGWGLATRMNLTQALHHIDVGTWMANSLWGVPFNQLPTPAIEFYLLDEPKVAKTRDYPAPPPPERIQCSRIPLSGVAATAVLVGRLFKQPPMVSTSLVQPLPGAPMSYTESLPDIQTFCGVSSNGNRSVFMMPGKPIPSTQLVGIGFNMGVDVSIGLGWAFQGGLVVDLDSSILMLDAGYNLIDTVSFRHLRSNDNSIVHSGDNRSGSSGGDAETITIALTRVNPLVHHLGVIINSFSGQQFGQLERATVRMHQLGRTFLNLKLTAGKSKTALIFCMLSRSGEGQWTIYPALKFMNGRTAEECFNELRLWAQKIVTRITLPAFF